MEGTYLNLQGGRFTQVKSSFVWDIADGVTGLRGNDTESKMSYLIEYFTVEAYFVNFTELRWLRVTRNHRVGRVLSVSPVVGIGTPPPL